jgi:hypothetical protein
MRHEELLGKAGEYLRAELSPPEMSEIARHLKTCAYCRSLVDGWAHAPAPPGFTEGIMTGLAEQPRRAFWAWREMAATLGTVAAAILILVAFWHPERDWVKADKSFASFEHSASLSAQTGRHPYE